MGANLVVIHNVGIEVLLHLEDVVVELDLALDAQVFVEQGTVEAFQKAVALRPTDLCCAMFGAFELQEQLVWVLVGPAAELPAIIGEHGLHEDLCYSK